MNMIKVKDYESMQAITVSLARNGYMVTVDSITDENYKEHWEIKYYELSEIKEKPIVKDHDCISSMEIHNNNCTKGVKCEILPDENPLVENEKDIISPNPDNVTVQRYKKPFIPNIPIEDPDTSDNINDEQVTVITSVSGN